MPKLDGIYYYGPDIDRAFIEISDNLERCPKLEKYHMCQNCPDFTECEFLHIRLVNLSLRHKLRPDEITKFRQLFHQRIGVMI